ncbi:GNAT family N-acetyltransferase [Paenibacillus taichungensis]
MKGGLSLVTDINQEKVVNLQLSFEILSSTEAKSRTKNIPLWKNQLGREVFDGFHFFAPLDFQWSEVTLEHQTFIMVIDGDKIVGVMLVVQDEQNPNHYGISYVDVHIQRRREGIATQLYKQLNAWVQSHFILSTSDLTQEGKKAKLNHVFRREINRCAVI